MRRFICLSRYLGPIQRTGRTIGVAWLYLVLEVFHASRCTHSIHSRLSTDGVHAPFFPLFLCIAYSKSAVSLSVEIERAGQRLLRQHLQPHQERAWQ